MPPPRERAERHTGTATVEAYTVPYDRDGEPEAAIISAITPGGARAIVRSEDPAVIDAILDEDLIGGPVELTGGSPRAVGAA